MPAKTDKQAITARIAGAIKKGLQKGKPGEPSTEMAKMPMKSLKKFMHTKKDKKVKKEGVIENARFFGVRKPSGEIAEKDMVFEFNPLEGVQKLNVMQDDVLSVTTDETEAQRIAAEAYGKYCNEVQALEEKKGKVGDKLKKTIDHLEKKRKEHVDMAKEDPKNASQHKEHIAKLASQIDDLMSKMEKIEKSKKNVEKKEDKKEDLKEEVKTDQEINISRLKQSIELDQIWLDTLKNMYSKSPTTEIEQRIKDQEQKIKGLKAELAKKEEELAQNK